MTRLSPKEEIEFRVWYSDQARKWGLDPNPDHPLHKYDYRGAFKAGEGPSEKDGHWPSRFKSDDHPNRFVDGKDTKAIDTPKNERKSMASSKSKWSPLMGISKEEFEKRKKKEREEQASETINPRTEGGVPTAKRPLHSAKIRKLLKLLGKTSGPAADALALKPDLTEQQVQRKIDEVMRKKKNDVLSFIKNRR